MILPPKTARAERIDVALACVTLAAFSGPGMMFLGVSDDPSAPPNTLLRLYWPPVYLLTLVLAGRRWNALKGAWPAGLLLAAPVLWAWATQAWSLAPDDTGRRGLALFMTTLFGVVLGGGFRSSALVRIIGGTAVVLAVGSTLTALAVPKYGVEQVINQGCWRGLWDTKNALAAFMMVGAVACACAALTGGADAKRWWAGFAACLFNLLMSRGKTSLVCLMLCLALLAVHHLGKRGPLIAVLVGWASGAVAIAGGFIALVTPELFFHAIGKDPTLTGRTEIWTALLEQVAQRPLQGFGFGAFWEKDSVPAKIIAKQTGWPAPEAHNGWLDILAQIGAVGLVLSAICAALALVLALTRRNREDGMFSSVFVIGFLALSFAESVLLSPNNLIWVGFTAALASLMCEPAAAAPVRRAPQRGASLTPPSNRMEAAFR